jgi:hypothetical protein
MLVFLLEFLFGAIMHRDQACVQRRNGRAWSEHKAFCKEKAD